MFTRTLALGLAFGFSLPFAPSGLAAVSPPPPAVERLADGIILPVGDGFLRLTACADNTIRVAYAKDHAFAAFRPSLIVVPRSAPVPDWDLTTGGGTATLSTVRCKARVDLVTGAVTFLDATGQVVLAEKAGGRSLDPANVDGEQTFHAAQHWAGAPEESLHGLGQQQLGIMDIKGCDLDLWQRNSVVVVPFLVSSRGFGILWDNPGYSRFGDLRPFEAIPAANLLDASRQAGGLTTGTFTANAPDVLQGARVTADLTRGAPPRGGGGGRGGAGTTRWVGEVVAPTTGDYQFQTYSNGGLKMWLDGKLVFNRWRQGWLTEYDQVKVHLSAGNHYAIRVESGGDQVSTMQLRWKTPAPADSAGDISLWSEVGDGVDYYFVYGPELDQVVAGYRHLTGAATMLPRWAFGLWQSYQRYERAQQSLDVVNGYRSRSIPFDNIVQDWQYWPQNAWGSHQFDPARFPDPVGWIKAIHDQHANLMISVWGKFYSGDYVGNENFKAMQAAGYLYEPTLKENIKDWVARGFNYTFYDAFNAGARDLFWKQINAGLFQKGVDAWWMDASEPDVVQPSPPTLATTKHFIGSTALGSPSRVLNGYALENSRGIYEGQRATAPDQRVFILTRSGFAGQQRYSAVTWSGDITSTWMTFAKQITAGLGFSISGNPYWTMDTGGYTMETRFSAQNITPANLAEWYELNARWFEFSAFTPFLRAHGELRAREMWAMGGETNPAYQAELKFDRLRYALQPYIYSMAGAVTQDGGTIMRPLVMDFRTDAKARDLTDQFMFGPAFLVSPVTTYLARSRSVYLPATPGGWYDFWSGTALAGGQTLDAPAPFDAMPLHIRAGAIIPFGPAIQYTGETPADPVTLQVYAGADGTYSLYEDDGLSNGYEKGQFARIPIRWNDATRTLTIGARTGSFTGMLARRTFQVVVVSKNKAVAYSPTLTPDETVTYTGAAVDVRIAP